MEFSDYLTQLRVTKSDFNYFAYDYFENNFHGKFLLKIYDKDYCSENVVDKIVKFVCGNRAS